MQTGYRSCDYIGLKRFKSELQNECSIKESSWLIETETLHGIGPQEEEKKIPKLSKSVETSSGLAVVFDWKCSKSKLELGMNIVSKHVQSKEQNREWLWILISKTLKSYPLMIYFNII